MSTDTLILVLASSNLACGFLGFLFGRMARATVEIEERMADSTTPPPKGRKMTGTHMLAAAMVFIGITTAIFGVALVRNQDRLAGCVVGYSNALGDALELRTQSSRAANDQITVVMKAFAAAFHDTPAVGRERVLSAIQDYIDTRDQANKDLKAHPLPEVPRDACAELLD